MTPATYTQRNGVSLSLDPYPPPSSFDASVMSLRCGAWLVGDRADHPERLTGSAERSITLVSTDYRLSDNCRCPAQPEDIGAAVDWTLAEGIAADTSKIVLNGASGGGAQLAPLTCMTSPLGIVGFGLFGCYDLTSRRMASNPGTACRSPPRPWR